MACWLIALTYFDIRRRRLPNLLTLPGAALVMAGAALTGHGAMAFAGAAAMFAIYAVVHLVAPQAMGAGDVKLALGLGALTGPFGPDVWLLAVLGASLGTALLGLIRLLGGDRSPLPHGPSMCIAAASAVAVGLI
ncbi:MAG: A24 family peptidase [Actinomycetia bacterium]|nr:A24 family peptidase [Actinomycetes bacterium]MCH9701171.1 A24 family peptidase [Actinomycetes bacterium]MCH9760281.1 A24 family peptidase [Actinomycetes bacterium]